MQASFCRRLHFINNLFSGRHVEIKRLERSNVIGYEDLKTNFKQTSCLIYESRNSLKFDFLLLFRPYAIFVRIFHSSTIHNMNKERKKIIRLQTGQKRLVKMKAKIDRSKTIPVWINITVRELGEAMGKDADHVFNVMEYIKDAHVYNSPASKIDRIDVIHAVAKKSGFRTEYKHPKETDTLEMDEESILLSRQNEKTLIKNRPPIVTIMGHVDHGKTTLLDTLRHSSIVSQEFGGITQHIGAFSVKLSKGEAITFLDTPGHAAFSAMRARGAMVTDIIIVVVAADDGVMPQSVESFKLAEEAKVPVVVAINKIDKPEANIEFCKKNLLQHGILLEEFGGDVQCVPISAAKGTNVDLLMETVATQAELMELKANYEGMVEGTVIESRVDEARGKLCTSLIQQGTLKKGAYLVAGTTWVKIRSMFDENGQIVQKAPPSLPVEIIGWKDMPSAGEKIHEVVSEKQAQKLVNIRLQKLVKVKQVQEFEIISKNMEAHFSQYRKERELRLQKGHLHKSRAHEKKIHFDDTQPKLQLIIKGDVSGTVEAILDVLQTYESSVCTLDVIHFGVGDILKTDVELASAFKGIIYGFNVSTLPDARILAKTEKVPLKHFKIIYRMIDDIKDEITQRLPMKTEENILGEASVLQEFIITEGKKKWPVAGCRCDKGILKKSSKFRVIRKNECVYQGKLVSMRQIKNEVDSIKAGVECGLRFEDETFQFIPGDTIQCYETMKVKQKINWDPGF